MEDGESRNGGGGGIRTRDTVSRIHTFQACAFSHSATPPQRTQGRTRTIKPGLKRLKATKTQPNVRRA